MLAHLVGIPAYVAADFNMILAELADAGWLYSYKLAPLSTDEVPTCFSCKPCAIDHILCSPFLAGITDTVVVEASVRASHFSVHLAMHRQPRKIHAMRQCLGK